MLQVTPRVLLVPGGGVIPGLFNTPGKASTNRATRAARLLYPNDILILSGGNTMPESRSTEAVHLLKILLEAHDSLKKPIFDASRIWLEARAVTSYENAAFAAAICREKDILRDLHSQRAKLVVVSDVLHAPKLIQHCAKEFALRETLIDSVICESALRKITWSHILDRESTIWRKRWQRLVNHYAGEDNPRYAERAQHQAVTDWTYVTREIDELIDAHKQIIISGKPLLFN